MEWTEQQQQPAEWWRQSSSGRGSGRATFSAFNYRLLMTFIHSSRAGRKQLSDSRLDSPAAAAAAAAAAFRLPRAPSLAHCPRFCHQSRKTSSERTNKQTNKQTTGGRTGKRANGGGLANVSLRQAPLGIRGVCVTFHGWCQLSLTEPVN